MNVTIDYINEWSSSLVDRLLEIRYVEPDVMKAALSSHFRGAIIDCMEVRFSELTKKINELKIKQAENPKMSFFIGAQISKLKNKKKEVTQIVGHIEHYDEYIEFKKFIRINHPDIFEKWKTINPEKKNLENR